MFISVFIQDNCPIFSAGYGEKGIFTRRHNLIFDSQVIVKLKGCGYVYHGDRVDDAKVSHSFLLT